MKFCLKTLTLLIVSLLGISGAHSQQVIINELYNSGTNNDEWIELLVVQDSLDKRSWDIRDFSSGGVAQASLI